MSLSENELEIWTYNLTKIYDRGNRKIKAVNRINISMEPGIHGFLGPNGAGKTTTINMLIGAISITEGEARLRGKKAGSLETRKFIGFLPQDPIFYKNMTGLQYLIFKAQLNGVKKYQAKEKAIELLEFFNLLQAKDQKMGKYSGGMKQKTGLASALIHDPKLLILDEPTTNLDPIGRRDIIDKIRSLSKDMSIFISSHILSEIEQMCEKVTIINYGEILLTDTIKNIKNLHRRSRNLHILDTNSNERVLKELEKKDFISSVWINKDDNKIYINPKDIQKLQKNVLELLSENNILLRSFFQPESTLQDIFIDLLENTDE